jgi:hypothetical protein
MSRTPTFQRRHVYGAIAAGALALAAMVPMSADAAQAVARFDGGIGVNPVTLAGGVGVANDVNPCPVVTTALCVNTPPPGRPWVIQDLQGQVDGDGSFDIQGKGLLLAGGANIGRTGGLHVRMRLYCGTGAAAASFTSTEEVLLEPTGDFRLRGQLQLLNPLSDCANSILLILNAGTDGKTVNGPWFAAGIPK